MPALSRVQSCPFPKGMRAENGLITQTAAGNRARKPSVDRALPDY